MSFFLSMSGDRRDESLSVSRDQKKINSSSDFVSIKWTTFYPSFDIGLLNNACRTTIPVHGPFNAGSKFIRTFLISGSARELQPRA